MTYVSYVPTSGSFVEGSLESLYAWLDSHPEFSGVFCDFGVIVGGQIFTVNVGEFGLIRQACQLASGPILVARSEAIERVGFSAGGGDSAALVALRLGLAGYGVGVDRNTVWVDDADTVRELHPDLVNAELAHAESNFRVRRGPSQWALTTNPVAVSRPSVSVVIPTCGSDGVIFGEHRVWVSALLESLRETKYSNFEVVVVADAATPRAVLDGLADAPLAVKIVEFEGPFHFGRKCNLGAFHASGDVLIFLNDDMQVIDPDWIGCLVDVLALGVVGIASPLLVYDDGTVQHGGHVHTGGFATQGGLGKQPSDDYDGHILWTEREVDGVSGACLAITAELFATVGGFADCFPTSFSDDDLCLKVRAMGRSVVWTPRTRLHHFETRTRQATIVPDDVYRARERWPNAFGV